MNAIKRVDIFFARSRRETCWKDRSKERRARTSPLPLGEMFPGIDENDSFRRFCLTGHRILSDTFRNGVSICISRLQLGIAREGSTKKFFGAMLLKENERDDKMIRIRLFVDLITVMMNVYLCLFVSMYLELISLLRFMSWLERWLDFRIIFLLIRVFTSIFGWISFYKLY